MTNNGLAFEKFFSNLAGQFAEHIDASIPNHARNRLAVASAIRGRRVLDVGASEGQMGNLLSHRGIETLNVDPNREMARAWKGAQGTSYQLAAWVEGFYDGVGEIPAYNGTDKFDAIYMNMVRQFVTRDADTWYGEAAKHLKDDGIFIVNVKVVASPGDEEGWAAREAEKDAYKLEHFSQEEISQKAEETLVGMHTLMLTREEEMAALRKHFRFVVEYWESYNFRGYVAGDDFNAVYNFVAAHEDSYFG